MELVHIFLSSIVGHPQGTLLFLVALFNLVWVFYIVFWKRNYKNKLYKAYFFYALSTLLWVISNAYFQTSFLMLFGEGFAKFMALLANVTATFAIIGFFYIASLMKGQTKTIQVKEKIYMIGVASIILFFNLVPNLTVKEVKIFENGTFELVFSPWNNVFFLTGTLTVFLGLIQFAFAFREKRAKLENMKFFYILFAMSTTFIALFVFSVLLPVIFNNYRYVWIPPVLSILDVLIVGYAILTKRFLDVRLLISNISKGVLAFVFSLGLSYLFTRLTGFIFPPTSFSFYFISLITAIFFYVRIHKLLNSHTFHQIFGSSNTQHIRQVILDLKEKNKLYTSVVELETDLQKAFSTKNRPVDCHVLPITRQNRAKYPELVKYFKSHHHILVTEEIKFVENEEDNLFPFLEELEALGGVCLPLFSPSKDLVGFFTLGKKQYDHLYSKEEIEALENMGSYLSMLLNDILYSSSLKKEVQRKTTELRKKIEETNELVRQQADFIAVTAHEFRTPLSIALFQMEDIVTHTRKPETLKDLRVVQSSLSHLKDLTKRLFEVQQYDLKKVTIQKTKVNAGQFLEAIHQDFLAFMMEKKIHFTFISHLKKNTPFYLDPSQIRQVLHNLLTNAFKFTPEGGEVSLQVAGNEKRLGIKVVDNGKGIPDPMKEIIFKKFRTGSKGAGIGLGLYICQKIIELHQGKLWVEDSPGQGATFIVQLENNPGSKNRSGPR